MWEPGWLAWKHHHLEALRCLSHLPHHALPLHWLLAGAQVPGTKNKMSDTLLCVLEIYRGLGAGTGVTKLPDCGKRKGGEGPHRPLLGSPVLSEVRGAGLEGGGDVLTFQFGSI